MSSARILLADDHEDFLRDFSAVLGKHHEILGTAADGLELVRLAASSQPDLILADISMPRLNGIAAVEKIIKEQPAPKCIFVTTHASPHYVKHALQIGARGYVLKMHAFDQIDDAIQTVLDGRIYLSSELHHPLPIVS